MVLDDVVVNFRCHQRLIAGNVKLGELVKQLGVFRAALAHGLEGEGGGLEEFEFEATIEKQVVRLIVHRILFEFLLDERKSGEGVFFGLSLKFHDSHTAGLEAEKSAFFLGIAGNLQLALAECFAAFDEAWALLQNTLEQRDRIIKIRGLNGGERFEPEGFDVRWKFFFSDLRHGCGTRWGFLMLKCRATGKSEVGCLPTAWQALVTEKNVV